MPKPGKIILFDMESGRKRETLTGHKTDVSSLAYSPDGRFLVSNADDSIVYLWDLTRNP
jgi:WD40 repeat protein